VGCARGERGRAGQDGYAVVAVHDLGGGHCEPLAPVQHRARREKVASVGGYCTQEIDLDVESGEGGAVDGGALNGGRGR